jgi:cytochrome c biogenesis protein CcdA
LPLQKIAPCNVAMIPLIIGYLGGSLELSRRRSFTLSLTFAVGLAITFMVLGVVASLAGGLIGGTSCVWYYLVAAVCIVIGVQMLGAFRLPQIPGLGGLRERVTLKGLFGALGPENKLFISPGPLSGTLFPGGRAGWATCWPRASSTRRPRGDRAAAHPLSWWPA